MLVTGPDTSRTDRACEHCNHFGGWTGEEEMAAWCNKNLYNNALSYAGCCDWTPQPVGWLFPPEVGPTPGLAVHGPLIRPAGARIR